MIVNLQGATLGILGSIFFSLFFVSPNPNSPTSLNERVRENAQFEVCENKVAQVNQLVVVAKRVLAAKKQTVSLINKLFNLYFHVGMGRGLCKKQLPLSKSEPVFKMGSGAILINILTTIIMLFLPLPWC